MFIRTKASANKTKVAIQIVENQRKGNTTKQKVLRHIGTGESPEEIEQLKRVAFLVKEQLESEARTRTQRKPQYASQLRDIQGSGKKNQLVDVSQLEEIKRYTLGIHDIYGLIYEQLGFTNLFTRPHQREKAANILREMTLARIAKPLSKRGSVDLLQKQFNISLELDHVYKMMDKMDERFCERIQQQALSMTLKLTGEKLRVLFYDATTLYFESFTEDELKKNGYSKDMKFNQPQILLVLFVTEKGLPVGYELFPGSTFEGHTLVPSLERLRARYQLEEVIVVADRGLLNEENLQFLEEKKIKYIVGSRIKNVSKKLQNLILDESNYQLINIQWRSKKNRTDKEPPVQRLATFDQDNGRKLVVHYHSKRAEKDAHDRSKSIEKLYKKLAKSKDPKSLLNNYGYKKYIAMEGEAKLELNQEKIKEASRWDGLLGIMTNIDDRPPEELLQHYRGLWQIEESFRFNKHDLKMRPIYHWKPQRVKAHIAISFMAFVCVRYLEYLLLVRSEKLSPEVIRKSLLQVQVSLIKDKSSGKQFLLSSALPEHAKRIYQVMGVKIPPHTIEICGA